MDNLSVCHSNSFAQDIVAKQSTRNNRVYFKNI